MGLVLIKEDGTGRADANSYASVADGDAYHEGHLYATAWTGAAVGMKEKALVFATRVIDAEFRFDGWRANEGQALEWPRVLNAKCRMESAEWGETSGEWAGNVVPRGVVAATCEMARELLITDRTAAPEGEGIESRSDGGTTVKYSKADTRPVISRVAQAMLTRFGVMANGGGGMVRVVRC